MQPMQRTRYSPEQKAEALELLATVGKAEAARRTGIPPGTIASWGSRNGVRAVDDERVHAARQAWAERRAVLADTLGEVADQATAKLKQMIVDDEVSAAELVRAIAVVVDRAQLLSGDATERTEQLSGGESAAGERRHRATGVVDELAARRAG